MQTNFSGLCAQVRRWQPVVAGALMVASLSAGASPIWAEDNALQSTLDSNWTYTSDAVTRTGVVSFTNQVATNTGATGGHFGMYLGWAWSYNSDAFENPLLWDNATQTFSGGGVSLAVARPGFGAQSLHLGDVVGDTWVGNPWPAGDPMPIATQSGWDVPLFDFGNIAAGASVNYDITLTFSFDDDTAFADWDRSGSFYLGGQGVRAVPEPGSFALAGLALLGLGVVARRSARRRALR